MKVMEKDSSPFN